LLFAPQGKPWVKTLVESYQSRRSARSFSASLRESFCRRGDQDQAAVRGGDPREYVPTQKRMGFTRFNVFLRNGLPLPVLRRSLSELAARVRNASMMDAGVPSTNLFRAFCCNFATVKDFPSCRK
jgi:hypothetical protein